MELRETLRHLHIARAADLLKDVPALVYAIELAIAEAERLLIPEKRPVTPEDDKPH